MLTNPSLENNVRFFYCRSYSSLSRTYSFKVINFSYWINCQFLHALKYLKSEGKTKSVGQAIEIKTYFRGLCASAFQKPSLWCTITHYKSTVITDNLSLRNLHFKGLVLIFHLPLFPPLYPSQKKIKGHLFWNKR